MDGYNVYVGARYVPILDGEWDSQKKYEPLTIVTYQGNSYTSRTYVPAGIDINNVEYWVVTGNYNAQVEEYHQEVVRLTNEYNGINENLEQLMPLNLKDKNVHFFGDSLTWGNNGTELSQYNYPKIFGEIMGCNIFNHAVNGATVTTIINIDNNLDNQIDGASNLINADYVFIQCGVNDYLRNCSIGNLESTKYYFKGAYVNAIKKIMSKIPNKCRLICLSLLPCEKYFKKEKNTYNNLFLDYNDAIKEVCQELGVQLIDVLNTIGINQYNYNNLLSDGVHLKDEGYAMLGRALSQALSSCNTYVEDFSSENKIQVNDFYNSFQFSNNFDVITGVCLDLTSGAKQSIIPYYFEKGIYTLKFDLYNENLIEYPMSNESTVVSINLINTTNTIECGSSYNMEIGLTKCKHVFKLENPGLYNVQAIFNTNITNKKTIVLANLSIVSGEINFKDTYKPNRVMVLNTYGNYIVPLTSGQSFMVKMENGCLHLACQFKSTATINVDSIVLNLPLLGNENNLAPVRYLIGYDVNGNVYPMYYDFNSGIKNLKEIPENTSILISAIIPVYF